MRPPLIAGTVAFPGISVLLFLFLFLFLSHFSCRSSLFSSPCPEFPSLLNPDNPFSPFLRLSSKRTGSSTHPNSTSITTSTYHLTHSLYPQPRLNTLASSSAPPPHTFTNLPPTSHLPAPGLPITPPQFPPPFLWVIPPTQSEKSSQPPLSNPFISLPKTSAINLSAFWASWDRMPRMSPGVLVGIEKYAGCS